MKKRKTYEISVIDRTYSKTISDETKFYTSDTALELVFKLKETEYTFESAEIVLLNTNDKSLITRRVVKSDEGFVYTFEKDIIAHYGEWKAQLMFIENVDAHVASPIKFRIENDLYNTKPQALSDVVSWVNLKLYAEKLVGEFKQAVDEAFAKNVEIENTFKTNEANRQSEFDENETTRQGNEDARIEAEQQREETVAKIESRQTFVENQFNAINQELTDKDVISAPEIIAARNGEENLKARLDKEQQEVTAQLADNVNYINQVDYVRLIHEHNEVPTTLFAKITGDRRFDVAVPFKGNRSAYYQFIKDTNDDFIKFSTGSVNDIGEKETSRKNYDSITGTWETTYPPTHYTTQVGATFTFSFIGTGFDFQSRKSDLGGIWEFVIDNDIANKKTISVFSATQVDNVLTPVIRGLAKGNHTVVATFKGDDPNNPPSTGAGTSRGWANFESITGVRHTIVVYDFIVTNIFDVFSQDSNKEFAMLFRPTGANYSLNFFPDHGVGTMFAVTQRLFFDDVRITNWSTQADMQEVKSVRLIQKMMVRHPENPLADVIEVVCIHTINAKGVSVKTNIKFLVDTDLGEAYGIMIPTQNAFAKRVITSFGNRYEFNKYDLSRTNLIEDDKAISYAFVNDGGTNGEPDTLGAVTIQDVKNTFRQDMSGQSDNLMQIQHRSESMHKMYSHIFYHGYKPKAGDTVQLGATFAIGELQFANDLL